MEGLPEWKALGQGPRTPQSHHLPDTAHLLGFLQALLLSPLCSLLISPCYPVEDIGSAGLDCSLWNVIRDHGSRWLPLLPRPFQDLVDQNA